MNLEYYLGLPYSVAVTPERCTDGSACYMARVVELPGCESHGDTPEQALRHLDEAKKLFIASMLEDGLTPEPPRNRNSSPWLAAAWVALAALPLLAGCGNDLPDDNGTPETASSDGADVFLEAVVDEVFAVGGVDAEAWDAFSRIDDAEFDSDGNLTLLDTEAVRLVVVGPDGAFLRDVSRRGNGPGELRAPASIVVLPDDRLVVYDIGHDAFLAFDPCGAFLEQYPANPDDDGDQTCWRTKQERSSASSTRRTRTTTATRAWFGADWWDGAFMHSRTAGSS